MERPRGTRDFLPEEMERRRRVEGAMRATALSFGYGEVQTPTFEHTDLFVARSGEAVVEEMYVFQDKGGRSLALRPELTAAVMRMYASDLTHAPKPLRLFYSGPCFRYERPQKGRYREFFQFGAELIGSPTPEADAEIIALAVRCIESAGLCGTVVRIGHVGALRAVLEWAGVTGPLSARAFPLIDKGETQGLEELLMDHVPRERLEALVEYVTAAGGAEVVGRARAAFAAVPKAVEHLARLEEALGHLSHYRDVLCTVHLGIARGLDYYTGVVFEVDYPGLGAEKQVCGGGAYELGQVFGLKEVPATGFAIGLDRVVLAAGEAAAAGGGTPAERAREGAVVVPMDRSGAVMALAVEAAEAVRAAGLRAELEVLRRPVGKALKAADEQRLRWAVIVGTDEAARGEVALKDLVSGEQRRVPLGDIAAAMGR